MELTPPPSKDGTKRPVFFENPDMDYMAQHFVGNLYRSVLLHLVFIGKMIKFFYI